MSIRILLYALLFTPLVLWTPLDFFFDSTKVLYLMALAELLLVCYLWLLVKDTRWRPRLNAVSIAFWIYLAVMILVSLLGVDPFHSFWASTDRINGLLFWLHLAAVFLVLSSVMRSREEWNRYFFVSTLVALAVGSIFLIWLMDPTFWSDSMGGSTLGNSTYFGAYLLFHVIFSLQIAFTTHSPRMKKYGYWTAAVFAGLILLTSALAAKGALLGGAVFAMALFLLFASKPTRMKKYFGLSLLVLLVVSFVYVWSALLFDADSRVYQAFVSASSGARLSVWEIGWNAFLDRPMFGWGLENFQSAFIDHFDPCFGASPCGHQMWFDKAHNSLVDTLVTGGLALLATYALVWIAALRRVWQASVSGKFPRAAALIFVVFAASYLVHNLVEFDVTVTWLFFVIVLAYAGSVPSADPSEMPTPTPPRRKRLALSLAVCATLVLPFTLYHSVIFPWVTNQTAAVMAAATMRERLPLYEKMVQGSPVGIDFRRVFLAGETAKLAYKLSAQKRDAISSSLQQEFRMAINGLEQSVSRAPNYLRGYDLLVLMYLTHARFFDPGSIEKAEDVARRSLAQNPNNQQAYWALAGVLVYEGRADEAFQVLESAIALNPEVADSYVKKLVAFKLLGQEEAFDAYAQWILQEFPIVQATVQPIVDLRPEEEVDWLYTVFY